MPYLSLYRKWRPQAFDEVVGQPHVVRTLQNALRTGRVAHAYLFAGPRGTGKTSVARLLAKGLNCSRGMTPEPCLQCESCRRIAAGVSLDCLEIDGASNRGIDEIRELRERSKFAPQEGRFKIYIIDEAHMLTTEAFNALLKTLEEPPEHVVFVLATTEAHRIPATIVSRCQRFDFHRFGTDLVVQQLRRVCEAEGVPAELAALELIAAHAEGGLRDALGLLDQCLAYLAEPEVEPGEPGVEPGEAGVAALTAHTVETVLGLVPSQVISSFLEALYQGDLPALARLVDEVFSAGADIRQFVRRLARELQAGLVARFAFAQSSQGAQTRLAGAGAPASSVSPAPLRPLPPHIEASQVFAWLDTFDGVEVQLRGGAPPKFTLDLAVVRLVAQAGVARACIQADADASSASARPGPGERAPVASPTVSPSSPRVALDAQPSQAGPAASRDASLVRRLASVEEREAAVEAQLRQLEQLLHRASSSSGEAGVQTGAETGAGVAAEPRAVVEAEVAPAASGAAVGGDTRVHGGSDTQAGSGSHSAVTIEQVQAEWGAVLELAHQRGPELYALLKEGSPAAVTGGEDGRLTLHLVFPEICRFHKMSLERPAERAVLERILTRQFHRAVQIEYHLGGLPADRAVGPVAPDGGLPGVEAGGSPDQAVEATRLESAGNVGVPALPSSVGAATAAGTPRGRAATAEPLVDENGRPFTSEELTLIQHPLVQETLRLFQGTVVRVELDSNDRKAESQ